jgi:hypothetical protein
MPCHHHKAIEGEKMRRLVWCCCLGVALIAAVALALNASSAPDKAASLAKAQAKRAAAVQSSLPGTVETEAPGWREIGSPATVFVKAEVSGHLGESTALLISEPSDREASLFDGTVQEITLGDGSSEHHPGEHLDTRCVLSNTEHPGVNWASSNLWDAGDKIKVWFNPLTCGASPYPFRIDSVELILRSYGAGTFVWCLDIECPLVPGDSCSGPSYELQAANCYQYVFTGAAAYWFKLNIDPNVCVSGPFFFGVEYVSWSGSQAQRPSVYWDTSGVSPICTQYLCDPTCTDWRDVWAPANWGRIRSRVYGNTGDACSPIACVEAAACTVTCQTGDIIECAETPGVAHLTNDCDGGCFSTPPQFGSIACGQTVCGVGFTYNVGDTVDYRDTDWYLFTLTEHDSVRVTAYAEFPVMIAIVDTDGCVNPSFIASVNNTFACSTTVLVSPCLAPGTYAVWVSPAGFTGITTPAEYRVTLQCYPCGQIVCTPDTTITTIPASWTSTTCGAADDCDLRIGEDRIVRVVIPSNGFYQFSLCGGTNWDSYIYLTDSCCAGTVIAEADEGCATGNLSQTECIQLAAGTYFLDIEPWDPTQQDPDCGPVTLLVETCQPCTPLPVNDDCPNAIPLTVNAANPTCSNNNCATLDCNQNPFHEVWYTFTLTDTCQNVRVRYCGTTISGSLGVSIFTDSCCGTRVSYDSYEYTSCPDGFITIHYDSLAAGTYWLPVNFSVYGDFCVRVTSMPCVPCVSCPPGAIQENEPNCEPGYVDVTNAGCNGTPVRFTALACGQTVCATSGTFDDDTLRDTDWFQFTLAQKSWVKFTVLAMFKTTVLIFDSSACDNLVEMAEDTANTCDTARAITALLEPGEYWAVVAPMFNGGHVECGTPYWATLECMPCGGVTQLVTDIVECTETPGPTHGDTDCSGGCNNDPNPHLYGAAACGQTVYGTSFTYSPTDSTIGRDTDWYHLVLADSQYVTLTVEADFVGYVFFMLYEDCVNYTTYMQFAIPQPCAPYTRTTTTKMAPGDYTIWVGPSEFFGVPYPSHYRLTLGCPCVPAIEATVYVDASVTNLVLRWVAPVAGTYKVFSTVSKTASFDPGTWTLETTVTVGSGQNAWTDPAATVPYKRYVVQHVCQ